MFGEAWYGGTVSGRALPPRCVGTYTAARSNGILASQRKNATTMKMEMMRGARTLAEPHPTSELLVTAKMKRISAAAISVSHGIALANGARRTCQGGDADEIEIAQLLAWGQVVCIGVLLAGNEEDADDGRRHGEDGYEVEDPVVGRELHEERADDGSQDYAQRVRLEPDGMEEEGDAPLPTPPTPPKMPMARACSFGSGKNLMMSARAEGMVSAEPKRRGQGLFLAVGNRDVQTPQNARRIMSPILSLTNPAPNENNPRQQTPTTNAGSTGKVSSGMRCKEITNLLGWYTSLIRPLCLRVSAALRGK